MAIYEFRPDNLEALSTTTFKDEGLLERQDLQRVLRDQIQVIDRDLMVLAEEFGDWDASQRRIDLLAIDRDGILVVLELKRTQRGGHMDLQAIRYAAMVSRMTFDQAIAAHAKFREQDREESERDILEFLGREDIEEGEFAQDTRIILVSADFSRELTTTVLWLNEHDLDVRCVRIKPYSNGDGVFLDVQQIIPLPETDDYLVRVKEKERSERRSREASRSRTKYNVTVGSRTEESLPLRSAVLHVVTGLCEGGVTPEEISGVIDWRRTTLWRNTSGIVDADEFAMRMKEQAEKGLLSWKARRWFFADDQLIHSDGQTWALSKNWGRRGLEAVTSLLERWPDHGVSLEQAQRSM